MIGRARAASAARVLLIATTAAFVACASPASTDQLPTGPTPAVTVLLRVRSPDGSQVELLARGVKQSELDTATTAVARSVFPSGQAGTPAAGTSAVERTTTSAVPVTLSDAAQTFTVTREQIDSALAAIHPAPRSVTVWACTDARRTIAVTAQGAGAVSSDVPSGSCKFVGTSLTDDGVAWSASVAVGELRPPSLLPVAIVTSVILLLLALVIALVRSRVAARDATTPGPDDASRADTSSPSVD